MYLIALRRTHLYSYTPPLMEKHILYLCGLKNIISSADPIQTNSQWCFHLIIHEFRTVRFNWNPCSQWQQWRWDLLRGSVHGNWLCEEHRKKDCILCINTFLEKGENGLRIKPKSVEAGLCQVNVLNPPGLEIIIHNPHHTYPTLFYMWEMLLTGSDEAKYITGNMSQPRSQWVHGGLINTSSIHPSIHPAPPHPSTPPPLHPPNLTSIKPSLWCHCTPSALFTAISLSRRRWCRSRGSLAHFPRVPFSSSFILSFIFSFVYVTNMNLCMDMNSKCACIYWVVHSLPLTDNLFSLLWEKYVERCAVVHPFISYTTPNPLKSTS